MLFLTFRLGEDRYAIESAQVIEVLPLVELKRIPGAPAGVAGLFNYHGASVPLIDLAELTLGKPSRKWMSTRIIVVNYSDGSSGGHVLGLLAEQATQTVRRTEEEFKDSGAHTPAAPYLGAVAVDASGILQRVEINHLLPQSLRSQLFQQTVASL
jgi:chemotaxis-related protein WspB